MEQNRITIDDVTLTALAEKLPPFDLKWGPGDQSRWITAYEALCRAAEARAVDGNLLREWRGSK